ncbi:unnamed protein product [Urochloa humidicola]
MPAAAQSPAGVLVTPAQIPPALHPHFLLGPWAAWMDDEDERGVTYGEEAAAQARGRMGGAEGMGGVEGMGGSERR